MCACVFACVRACVCACVIQSTQDKVFSCLLFTVLFTIISIISSTILKLHMGLVLFLDQIWSHKFIGGYSFFYFYCAGMLQQNNWEQRPMCSTKKQVHRTSRIITLQEVSWVTDGGMLYIGLQKMNSTTDSKTSKVALYFLP